MSWRTSSQFGMLKAIQDMQAGFGAGIIDAVWIASFRAAEFLSQVSPQGCQ